MSKDGQFQIFYRNGYAFLTVYPPSDFSGEIYPEDVLGRIKVLGIHNVRRQVVVDIIEKASGKAEPIAEWPEGKNLGPQIGLETTEDKMTAKIIIKPGRQGGEPLSVKFISEFLKSNGIVFGIDESILNSVVLKQVYNQSVSVAFGRDAIDEKAAEPEYFFLTDRGKPFKELEYQRIDLKELNFIQNRKQGDVLAKLNPALPPMDGMNIYGEAIIAKRGALPINFEAGSGAVMTDEPKSIIAEIDGNAKLENGKVIIEPLITVENVDYSNGNMNFNGAIDIQGRIADGFNIKAKGDIQVGKSLSRVHISCGGDIILKAGISGNDEGYIECAGDLYARYIESANILCKGSVFVEEAIMHSNIKAGGDIILNGKRAEIFGGKIFASGSIKCKKLGSINEPFTELFLGLALKDYVAMEKLQKVISEHNTRLDEVETQIRQIKNALKNYSDQDGTEQKLKLEKALYQLSKESEIRTEKLNSMLHKLHELKKTIHLDESSIMSAEQQIYGKVHVYFNNIRWDSPSKGMGKTSLMVKKGTLLEK